MKNFLRESRREIALGLVLIAIPSFITWILPGGWETVWNWVKNTWKWLGDDGTLPHWLIIILWICVALVVGFVVLLGILKIRQSGDSVEDGEKTLYGILWRWRWTKYGIQDLHAFCPKCDFQVYPRSMGLYTIRPETLYECDNPECGRLRKEFHGQNPPDVEDLVTRKIQQEFRRELRNPESKEA